MNYIGILKLRNTDTEINNLMDEFTTTETWKRNSVCQKNRSENIPNEAKREGQKYKSMIMNSMTVA